MSVLSLWFECWVLAGAMAYVLGAARSRVPGSFVGRLPLLKVLGRGRAAKRADAVLTALARAGVDSRHLPDPSDLGGRIRERGVGGTLSSLLLSTPVFLVGFVVIAAVYRQETQSYPAPPAMSVWFLATLLLVFPSVLPVVLDDWGVRRSDASGTVTMRAVAALETLLLGEGVTGPKTLLEARASTLNRLCHALRDQARHESRAAGRRSARSVAELTDLLIRNIRLRDHQLNFAEDDPERARAVRRSLAELISSALRYSCRPRRERAGLGVVDPGLLSTAAEMGEEEARSALYTRLAKSGAQLALAAALLAAAAFLAPRGVATGALAILAVALLIPVCRSLSRRLGYEIRLPELSWGTGDSTPAPVNGPPTPADARDPQPGDDREATGASSAGSVCG